MECAITNDCTPTKCRIGEGVVLLGAECRADQTGCKFDDKDNRENDKNSSGTWLEYLVAIRGCSKKGFQSREHCSLPLDDENAQ